VVLAIVAWGWATMRWYRIHSIGPDEHFTRGETIYCPTDAEALAAA
jgi:hypothetical protein